MSQNLPNMLDRTIEKIRSMVDSNSVVGEPIVAGDVTMIPISKISIGLGGGGGDMPTKTPASGNDVPFGGGVGAGVKVTPIAFIVIKGDSVRMLPVAQAPNTTADRVVEMVPDVLDRISAFVDQKTQKPQQPQSPDV